MFRKLSYELANLKNPRELLGQIWKIQSLIEAVAVNEILGEMEIEKSIS